MKVLIIVAMLAILVGILPRSALAESSGVSSSPAFPLKVSANHRYLVDQNDAPFLMVGDSPQAMIGDISEADAEFFLANRQASGFNTQWINLLCNNYTACASDGSTFDGIHPFTTPGDLSTPNETYFSKVDRVLRLAANHGQLVLLDPIETGGWTGVATSNGTTKAYNYGKFLGQRYKNVPNIIWMSGNDFQSWGNASDDAAIRAVAQGIKENDPNHIQTIELSYPRSGSLDDTSWTPLLGLDAAYTYSPTYDGVLKEFNRASMPVFMVEANYEGEHNASDPGTPQILRRQEYWTLLSGATGQLFGNHVTWQFMNGWKSNLDTPGSVQMKYVTALFAPRQWHTLVPDQNHAVVTDGFGTYDGSSSLASNSYLTAARSADGSLVLAYMPTVRTITVDLSRLAGSVTARWYDPTRGTFSAAVAGSPFANAGAQQFSPPGNNADGDGDWVLVLETGSVATQQAPPATPQPQVGVPTAVAPPVPAPVEPAPAATPAPVDQTPPVATPAPVDQATPAPVDQTPPVATPAQVDQAPPVPVDQPTPVDQAMPAADSPAPVDQPTPAPVDQPTPAPVDQTPPAADSPAVAPATAAPAGAGAGPAFVQANNAVPQSPQASVTVSYPLPQTTGDTNVLAIGWNDASSTIASVSDSAGNAYDVAAPLAAGSGLSQAIYYAKNITASGSNNTVTVRFSGPVPFADVRILEYSGLDRLNPFETSASASGDGAIASSGTASTSAPSRLVVGAGMTVGAFGGADSKFVSRILTTPDADLVEDRVVSAPGTYAASAPVRGAWLMQLAAFH